MDGRYGSHQKRRAHRQSRRPHHLPQEVIMDDAKLNAIVDAIVRELQASGAVKTSASDSAVSASVSTTLSSPSAIPVKPRIATSTSNLTIDLPDPTLSR